MTTNDGSETRTVNQLTEPAPDPESTLVVTDRRRVADSVVALTIQHEDGRTLPPWSPGAHIDFVLAPGLERQYSLCGDPGETDRWRVAVLREPDGRGGSAFVHDKLDVGDSVTVRGPRNHFELQAAPSYRFIAGGIGITPILPMIAEADRAGADWRLWYGGRSLGSMAFRDELAPYGDRVRLWPEESNGLLPLADMFAAGDSGSLVYCCGPEPLLRAVEERCSAELSELLHLERFSPKEIGEPLRCTTFRVHCRQSGTTVEVPAGQSVLAALEDAGLPVDSSCREGTCGTCETAVVSGRVQHRDSVLTAEEQAAGDRMMICVSRAAEDDLVLDV